MMVRLISFFFFFSFLIDEMILGGIGKLVDGVIGNDENSSLSWNQSPASFEFHFDVQRHFKAIQIHTMSKHYQSIEIKFDDIPPIKHYASPMESSVSNVFVDTIQLMKYGNIFIGKRVEIVFEFNNEVLRLAEITFDNELATFANATAAVNHTTNCSIGREKNKEDVYQPNKCSI